MEKMESISTIITAYDQHDITVEHVKGCLNSELVPNEIVVVNDGGSPDLLDMLKEIPHPHAKMIYARVTEDIPWNQQGARNLGVWLSTGSLLAMEDNDHIPDKNFYRESSTILANKEKGYIVPRVRAVVELDDIKNKPQEDWRILKTRGKAIIISMCRRELMIDTKGYDEDFSGRYGWEIPEWEARIKEAGAEIICNGRYFTIHNAYSRMEDREHDGRQFKMDPINYHHSRRSMRNKRTQNPGGILRFNYEIRRF